MKIWDTAGSEKYMSISAVYYRYTVCVCVCVCVRVSVFMCECVFMHVYVCFAHSSVMLVLSTAGRRMAWCSSLT